MNKIYTGIGSRETPKEVQKDMILLAQILSELKYTLRSGGASGADAAFETGHTYKKEIYLPYDGFNGRNIDNQSFFTYTHKSTILAESYHPAWYKLSKTGKQMHSRNMHQVLGLDLMSPTNFIICWTRDGQASGGTGQALRVAEQYGIPIYNLKLLTPQEICDRIGL